VIQGAAKLEDGWQADQAHPHMEAEVEVETHLQVLP
jgi:hypothetical protein